MATDPDETKPAISFATDAEFQAAVDKKLKPRIKEASEKAAAAALAGVLEKLGLESVDAVDEWKARFEKSEGAAKSEADKLRAASDKSAKELAKVQARAAELEAYRVGSLKQKAILEHAQKTVDVDTLTQLLAPQLTVGEDGAVTWGDGKKVDDGVAALLEQKAFLRAPAYKPGAATGAVPAKAPPAGAAPASGEKPKGPPNLSEIRARAVAEMIAATQGQTHP